MGGLRAVELWTAVVVGFVFGGIWGERLWGLLVRAGGWLFGQLVFQLYRLWWRWRSWRGS